jgi:parvulin-like peptidyl-prolyl isomerase
MVKQTTMKQKIKKFIQRKKGGAEASDVPRITNDTVAEHREEVLKGARKYIYPLQHSKHRIVIITSTLFIAAVIGFFTYTLLALYRFQDSTTFLYRVTQVIPFPVARIGGKFVAYENYLFELRRYVHYYESQLKTDFNDPANKGQLDDFKKRAIERVTNNFYTNELASKYNVSVSEREVDDQIAIVRSQNRLGNSDRVFEDVLKDYWGWSEKDFRRSLRAELLAQKVVASVDTQTKQRADAALAELKAGADFATTAKKYSDEKETKDQGGEYGVPIDKTSRSLSAIATDTLFGLQPGQYSEVINTGYALEIVKNIEVNGTKVRAAHIVFNFKDINEYIKDIKNEKQPKIYIKN